MYLVPKRRQTCRLGPFTAFVSLVVRRRRSCCCLPGVVVRVVDVAAIATTAAAAVAVAVATAISCFSLSPLVVIL